MTRNLKKNRVIQPGAVPLWDVNAAACFADVTGNKTGKVVYVVKSDDIIIGVFTTLKQAFKAWKKDKIDSIHRDDPWSFPMIWKHDLD